MRLLVGYDGSECAVAALEDLHHAGLPAEVDAIVISVADSLQVPERAEGDPPLTGWLAAAIERAHAERLGAIEQMRIHAASAAERLRHDFPTWTLRAEAVGDSPAWGILKRSWEWQPHLIALGSHGHSALGRFFVGSVSQKVLTTADCSVRIARKRGGDGHTGLRLIVGVDGSSHAARAVSAVKERFWPDGTVVHLVSALDAFMSTAVISQDDQITQWMKEGSEVGTWAQKMASAAANELRGAGLNAEAVTKPGDPKGMLVTEAEAWDADCIFVGAQGLNAVERAILGSVSAAVAARAPCTVEVVRSPGTSLRTS